MEALERERDREGDESEEREIDPYPLRRFEKFPSFKRRVSLSKLFDLSFIKYILPWRIIH